jgi:predicted ABC-type sugar transport system permease subunit
LASCNQTSAGADAGCSSPNPSAVPAVQVLLYTIPELYSSRFVVTNTIIGALVIMSLTNGMNLMGIDISYQYIVKGIIFILAVAFDVKTKKQA